jgi:hypothetical protein
MVPFTEWIGQLRAWLTAAPAADSPLSRREGEVARLVGQGLTSKQIGQTLAITPENVLTAYRPLVQLNRLPDHRQRRSRWEVLISPKSDRD